MNSPNGFVSNIVGVAAIAENLASIGADLQAGVPNSDRNLDCSGREPIGDAVSQHNHAIN